MGSVYVWGSIFLLLVLPILAGFIWVDVLESSGQHYGCPNGQRRFTEIDKGLLTDTTREYCTDGENSSTLGWYGP